MKSLRSIFVLLIVAGISVVSVAAQEAQTLEEICAAAVPAPEPESRTFSAPEEVLEPGVDYRAILCTETGPVYVDLFEDATPFTVNNFVFLAENGYYNNTTFHRVLQDFMAQAGDPTGTGTGSPGYQFKDEFIGFLHFDKPGLLAMANANQPDQGLYGTNGSQFFITTAATSWLDYRHTIFGEVLAGQENVLNLKLRDPQSNPDFAGARLDTVVIITDPASVDADVPASEPADQDAIVAAFENVVARLSERYGFTDDIGLESTSTGVLSTADVVASAPEDQQDAYSDFLDRYHHQYRVSSTLTDTTCSAPFVSGTYTVDVFDTAEDAAAALADGYLSDMMQAAGYTEKTDSEELPQPYYVADTTACDAPAQHDVTHWQRGRFLITIEADVPETYAAVGDLVLSQVVGLQLYEFLATDILRPELR